jgi:hypothetical protein
MKELAMEKGLKRRKTIGTSSLKSLASQRGF